MSIYDARIIEHMSIAVGTAENTENGVTAVILMFAREPNDPEAVGYSVPNEIVDAVIKDLIEARKVSNYAIGEKYITIPIKSNNLDGSVQ